MGKSVKFDHERGVNIFTFSEGEDKCLIEVRSTMDAAQGRELIVLTDEYGHEVRVTMDAHASNCHACGREFPRDENGQLDIARVLEDLAEQAARHQMQKEAYARKRGHRLTKTRN